MKFKKATLLTGVVLGSMSMSFAFTDLTPEHWAYSKVTYMTDKGIVSGYLDGTFRPDNEITREEFATILTKTLELKSETSNTKFADVADDRWSKSYIDIVSSYLTGSLNDGNYYFNPTSPAIREDVAVAVVKAKGLDNEDPDYTLLEKFSDNSLMSEDTKKYIAIALKNEMMNGNADGTFNPKGGLTRAEIVALVGNITDTKLEEFVLNKNDQRLQDCMLKRVDLDFDGVEELVYYPSKVLLFQTNFKIYGLKNGIFEEFTNENLFSAGTTKLELLENKETKEKMYICYSELDDGLCYTYHEISKIVKSSDELKLESLFLEKCDSEKEDMLRNSETMTDDELYALHTLAYSVLGERVDEDAYNKALAEFKEKYTILDTFYVPKE